MNINTYLSSILLSTNIDKDLYKYLGNSNSSGNSYNLFPQLNIEGSINKSTKDNLVNQNKLVIKWLDTHLITRSIEPFKSVTTWYIGCLLYNNIPICILRNTENNEDVYPKSLIINYLEYMYAAAYIFTFIKEDFGPQLEPYDISGSFSGDITPNLLAIKLKHYDLNLVNDANYLTKILDYTEQYNY